MGNAMSQSQCYKQYPELIGMIDCDLDNYNLGNVSDKFKSNAEIAGIGIDLAFAFTSILSLICSGSILIFCDYLRKASLRKLLEPAALSFSDQQIITGIALSVSTMFFETACEISAYHYNIVCFLVFLSIVSHLVGIVGLRGYTTQRPHWLGYFRMFLITVQVYLVFRLFSFRMSPSFPINPPSHSNLTSLVLPFVCFQDLNETLLYDVEPQHTSDGLVFLSFLAVFYAVILLLAEASKLSFIGQQRDDASQDGKTAQASQGDLPAQGSFRYNVGIFRGVVLLLALGITIYTISRLMALRSWMDNSGWLGKDNEENEWTFGQLLPMVILFFAPLAILDAVPDFLEAYHKSD